MDPNPGKDVFLIITDISGYTRFMVAQLTAWVHGQYISSELTKAVINQVAASSKYLGAGTEAVPG